MKIPDDEFSSSTSDADNMPSTSSGSNLGASPAIDRHNPIILSESRRSTTPATPLTVMINSNRSDPQHKVFESIKNSSAKEVITSDSLLKKPKSTVGKSSVMMMSSSSGGDPNLFTPTNSSRYLLSETVLSDGFTDLFPVMETVRDENKEVLDFETDEKGDLKLSTSDSNKYQFPSIKKSEQVVVLRVSLHCKGCAAKVRKHISRMEGVTSFNIDFAAKKVTVVGDVTPLTVLATITKVKNAQLWTTDNTVMTSRIAS